MDNYYAVTMFFFFPGISEEEEPEKIIIKKKNKSFYCIEPGCQRSYSSLHHLKVCTIIGRHKTIKIVS